MTSHAEHGLVRGFNIDLKRKFLRNCLHQPREAVAEMITAITQNKNPTIESKTGNSGRGRGQCGRGGRCSSQWSGVRGRRSNLTPNTSSIQNLEGTVEEFGSVLGNTAKQR